MNSEYTELNFLLGPGGIGKGAALDRFRSTSAECFEVKPLILEKIENDLVNGPEAKKQIREGGLVKDHLINFWVAQRLDLVNHNTTSVVVVDGANRTLAQTRFMREYAFRNSFNPQYMVFDVKNRDEFFELCLERMYDRIAKEVKRAESLGVAPKHRPDDNPVTLRARFDLYLQNWAEIRAYLEGVHAYINYIEPRKSMDEVFTQIYINTGMKPMVA